jgi:hypothetical protein
MQDVAFICLLGTDMEFELYTRALQMYGYYNITYTKMNQVDGTVVKHLTCMWEIYGSNPIRMVFMGFLSPSRHMPA